MQGNPLATTLRVKVVAVRRLTIADRVLVGKENHEHVEEEAATMDKQDGVAIEISSPLAAVRRLHLFCEHPHVGTHWFMTGTPA